ncbi:MAG: YdbL family protein [Pseudomonadota bacterium]
MIVLRYLAMLAFAVGTAIALTALNAPPAEAQGAEINAAKAAGVVGERIDGYLGVVNDGGVDVSLRRRINEINARRRAAYDEIADDAGVAVAQVARLTGEKQVERVAPGQYFMDQNGRWVRKAQ